MCGIFAIHDPKYKVSEQGLAHATSTLAHRGPDGQGTWLSADGHVGIGHRILHIMDAQSGKQPLLDLEQSICVSVNGELYEDVSIRKQLEAKGHEFRTASDSELIIHLYKEYGMKLTEHLRGEYAFILYDASRKITIAARDRFGIKPLYYHQDASGRLTLSSEAKAIFASGIQARWNEHALYHSLCFQYIPQGESLFEGVMQLPPGHILIFNGDSLTTKHYWDLDYPTAEPEGNFESLSEQLLFQLKDAIGCRLRSDNINICCHLSGGIDSAAIAALASEHYGRPIDCFSVSFPHAAYDEIAIAQAQAKKIGAAFHPVQVGAEEMINALPDAVYYSEGLAINNHLSAKFILNREIRKAGFKIALSGEGSDEIFLGYPHLKQDYYPAQSQAIYAANAVSLGVQISQDVTLPMDSWQEKLGSIPSFVKAKASIGYKLHQLINAPHHNHYEIYDSILQKDNVFKQIKAIHPLYKAAYLWIKFALAGYILRTLGDGCEMAHGVEGRVPFLDHHLFEFSKKIPLHFKIHEGVEKYILRETVRPYVTEEIYQRQKHPFMAPPLALLKNNMGIDFINDTLRSSSFTSVPFFDVKKVALYLDNLRGKPDENHVAAEPVIMLMLTSCILAKQYKI